MGRSRACVINRLCMLPAIAAVLSLYTSTHTSCTWDGWRAQRVPLLPTDKERIVAGPHFRDPAQGDYRVRASPAWKLRWKALPWPVHGMPTTSVPAIKSDDPREASATAAVLTLRSAATALPAPTQLRVEPYFKPLLATIDGDADYTTWRRLQGLITQTRNVTLNDDVNITFTHALFTGLNSSSSGKGGAIYFKGSHLQIENSSFASNTASKYESGATLVS